MKTWDELKEEIKCQSESDSINIEAIDAEIALVNKIITARKDRGLSQKQLADKINVSLYQIKRFESKVSSPRLDLTLSIMRALNLELVTYKNIDICKAC